MGWGLVGKSRGSWFDGTGGAGRTKAGGPSRMDAVAGLQGARTRSEGLWKSWKGIWKAGSWRRGNGVARAGRASLGARLSGIDMVTWAWLWGGERSDGERERETYQFKRCEGATERCPTN